MDKIKEFFKNYWLMVAIGVVVLFVVFRRPKNGVRRKGFFNY